MMGHISKIFRGKLRVYIIFILSIIVLISVGRAFQQAQDISFDLSFSPTKLVSEGINHYEYILDGKRDYSPNDRIMYSQNGVYAQGLFVLLIPLTLLGWDAAKLVWSLLNIALSFLIPFILCKKFELNRIQTLIIIGLFLTSTIFRIHISYGQHTLFAFVFLLLPFLFKSKISTILSGISYFKFNIGYVLFLYFLSTKNILKILLSLIPCVIGWISYCYITDTELLKNLFQPIILILYWDSGQEFPVTIFSLLKNINKFPSLMVLLIPLLLNFFVILKIKLVENELYKVSIICLTALGFMPHQLHDYILLLPLLVLSIKNFDLLVSKINLIFIFYFFYFLRIVSLIYGTQPWDFPYGNFGYFNNFLTILFIGINLYLNKSSNKIS
jgi:hypothetical protein|tara:strand:+ start:854 stop:2008 length:1155 start_codon:yes stop_codon:yes gene_type:complete